MRAKPCKKSNLRRLDSDYVCKKFRKIDFSTSNKNDHNALFLYIDISIIHKLLQHFLKQGNVQKVDNLFKICACFEVYICYYVILSINEIHFARN